MESLLQHLERRRFDGAPRHLGGDPEGRERFSFIAGDVPSELGHYDDAVLLAAASLIRRFHQASAGLFAVEACRSAGAEVACHNDLSPCNAVFRAGLPVALIDFDAAAPGRVVDDLGYAIWLWLDIGNDDYAVAEQRRRLKLFLQGYGDSRIAGPAIVEAMIGRQERAISEGMRAADPPMSAWAKSCMEWTKDRLRNSLGRPN